MIKFSNTELINTPEQPKLILKDVKLINKDDVIEFENINLEVGTKFIINSKSHNSETSLIPLEAVIVSLPDDSTDVICYKAGNFETWASLSSLDIIQFESSPVQVKKSLASFKNIKLNQRPLIQNTPTVPVQVEKLNQVIEVASSEPSRNVEVKKQLKRMIRELSHASKICDNIESISELKEILDLCNRDIVTIITTM